MVGIFYFSLVSRQGRFAKAALCLPFIQFRSVSLMIHLMFCICFGINIFAVGFCVELKSFSVPASFRTGELYPVVVSGWIHV